jgi:RNA polymerase sigma-70 factor (ECF subfamily)
MSRSGVAARYPVPSVAVGERPADLAAIFADEAAFRLWYERQAPRVYAYLHGRCGGDAALAEELTQQAFLHAIRGHRSFDGRSDQATWLIAIARNRLVDHFRRLEREERRHLRLVVREMDTGGAEQEWANHDVRAEVVAALRQLPAAQRAALILHHVDGLPVREVATALGRSASAVESLLARGRDRFRAVFGGELDG